MWGQHGFGRRLAGHVRPVARPTERILPEGVTASANSAISPTSEEIAVNPRAVPPADPATAIDHSPTNSTTANYDTRGDHQHRQARRWRLGSPTPRCTASTAIRRTSREPCFVIRPRWTVMSDSWCFGVSPAQEALFGSAEATDVADVRDHRGLRPARDPIGRINGASFVGRWEAFAVALWEDRARRSAIEG